MNALPFRQLGDRVELLLLGAPDAPWIDAILDEVEAARGQPWRVLLERIARLPARTLVARQDAVLHTIRGVLTGKVTGGVAPARLREALFGPPALAIGERERRMALAAAAHAITPEALEARLWADLAAEREVAFARGRPAALEIAAQANLTLIQRALARSHGVTLRVRGNARAVIRTATVRGLLTTARRRGDDVELEISGPLALFHRTSVYGRALGSMVPHLAWCEQYHLEARCDLGRGPGTLVLRPPLLLPPSPRPRRFDSALEERLARDLATAAPAWRVMREPAPVEAGYGLVFPDFLAEHRDEPARRWWIEIVGYWSSAYLVEKLARYRAAALPNVILCIDAQRAVTPEDLPPAAEVVRFRRRVDAREVLAIMER